MNLLRNYLFIVIFLKGRRGTGNEYYDDMTIQTRTNLLAENSDNNPNSVLDKKAKRKSLHIL